MEEKEKYEIHIYDDICVDLYDNGVLDKSINDTYKLEEFLNQQGKQIKELKQENQQLKQQLEDTEESYNITMRYLNKTRSELLNLPKKIVEDFYDEIRHRVILEDDYCPDHNLERKYGVRKCLLEDIRTTILKKYGGIYADRKNDSKKLAYLGI